MPLVINSTGHASEFSAARVVGHLVRRGIDAERALRHADDLERVVEATPIDEITTDELRRIIDELIELRADPVRVALGFQDRLLRHTSRTQRGPLADHRVRLALNHALDRAELRALLDQSTDQVDPFPHAPGLARELLAVAGYSNGLELRVLTADETLLEHSAYQRTVEHLSKVGVRLETMAVPWQHWITSACRGDDSTLFHAGAGVFLSQLGPRQEGPLRLPPQDGVLNYLGDLLTLTAQLDQTALTYMVSLLLAPGAVLANVPPRQVRDRRRMQVWMWEDGFESLVVLFAWWPAMTTASRLNTADSIRDLIDGTLDEAVSEGACFERLEIMSHGNTGYIKLGDTGDTLSVNRDFDASGNPSTQNARDLLVALERAMCPNGHLIFTACNQAPGTLLRYISAYIKKAVTVSGYAGTGYPDIVPGGDALPPDLHFQNGSTATP